MLPFLALFAQATTPAPVPTPVPAPAATTAPVTDPARAPVKVRLDTAAGPIVIAVDREHAPLTAANFLRYVDAKKLDGVGFYRAVKVGDGFGLAQFGTRNDPKRTLPPVAFEPTSKTGLSHVDGAVSMAMAKPGTAAGDFFVVVGDLKSMDAHDNEPGFAVFGRVIEGMDVIRRILASPTSPTEGVGVMKGQMLAPTIRIASARREP
ncbi:peptidylprolyl isomerase [Sphingomonas sp. RHCKR47]|uniref:peptidylprolyl isomerase n=1 Tax=Sphingomonas citricola TaxID=2862498 RepID=UPI001C67F378|nr:peptidylprolyl isomerase [Sphingomonas citricola]MBW6522476.1 peptidylprolyl isomerase [Sphingomonas citricola]